MEPGLANDGGGAAGLFAAGVAACQGADGDSFAGGLVDLVEDFVAEAAHWLEVAQWLSTEVFIGGVVEMVSALPWLLAPMARRAQAAAEILYALRSPSCAVDVTAIFGAWRHWTFLGWFLPYDLL